MHPNCIYKLSSYLDVASDTVVPDTIGEWKGGNAVYQAVASRIQIDKVWQKLTADLNLKWIWSLRKHISMAYCSGVGEKQQTGQLFTWPLWCQAHFLEASVFVSLFFREIFVSLYLYLFQLVTQLRKLKFDVQGKSKHRFFRQRVKLDLSGKE